MGKFHRFFLCLVIVVACGYVSKASDLSADQNATSDESETDSQEEFLLQVLDKLSELEELQEDVAALNATIPKLTATVDILNEFISNQTIIEAARTTTTPTTTTTTTTTPTTTPTTTTTQLPVDTSVIYVHTDQTLEADAKGAEVVKAVIDKIHASGIFPDDHSFLQRLAYAESKYGEDPQTFRSNSTGGIWQISRENYEKTKTSAVTLGNYHNEIQRNFNINWLQTNWTDLQKPLYSGLAARLLLASFSGLLPQVLTRQANIRGYQNLTSEIGLSKKEFNSQIKQLEADSACTGKIDLLVILDESGSVGVDHFKKSLEFVGNLFKSYSNASRGNVRLGFMTYSHLVRLHVSIENSLSLNEIYRKVKSTSYKKGGALTNRAIQKGIDQLLNGQSDQRERDGVPKIMVLLTDGKSADGVSNSDKAAGLGITNFAVGIGKDAKQAELPRIANYDAAHIFSLQNFEALTEFFARLSSATCAVAQNPKTGTAVIDDLGQDEKRFYCYAVPSDGVTLTLTSSLGEVTGYFSYSYKTPLLALNDGVLNQARNFIPHQNSTKAADSNSPAYFKKDKTRENCDVYVTIQGVGGPRNNYTVTAQNEYPMNNNTMQNENTNKNNTASAELYDYDS